MSDQAAKVVQISGYALPGPGMRARLTSLGLAPNAQAIGAVMEDIVTVDALARVLTEAIDASVTKDGRLDTKDVAAFVLRRMKEHHQ